MKRAVQAITLGALNRGFTLVETLVTIAVIALLVAIILPSLASSRRAGFMLKSLVSVRSNAQFISAYCNSNAGQFPVVIEGRFYDIGRGSSIAFPFWQVEETWAFVVQDHWPTESVPESVFSPKSSRESPYFLGSYRYSWSFVAKPSLWNPDTSVTPETFPSLVGVRDSDVRFSSRKALLWDAELAFAARRPTRIGLDTIDKTPIAFADGSGSVRSPAEATSPVENRTLPPSNAKRLRNTFDGVWGYDY